MEPRLRIKNRWFRQASRTTIRFNCKLASSHRCGSGLLQILLCATFSGCGAKQTDQLPTHSNPVPSHSAEETTDPITTTPHQEADRFVSLGYKVQKQLAAFERILPNWTKKETDQLVQAIQSTEVKMLAGPLIDNQGAIVDARFIAPRTIEVDYAKWLALSMTDLATNEVPQLVFHEYLRVMGINDDNYVGSIPIAQAVGSLLDPKDEGLWLMVGGKETHCPSGYAVAQISTQNLGDHQISALNCQRLAELSTFASEPAVTIKPAATTSSYFFCPDGHALTGVTPTKVTNPDLVSSSDDGDMVVTAFTCQKYREGSFINQQYAYFDHRSFYRKDTDCRPAIFVGLAIHYGSDHHTTGSVCGKRVSPGSSSN